MKRIFKNFEELQFCLCFGGGKPVLVGYTDADMACDIDSRKSTSGLLVTFVGKLFLGCLNYKVCCLIYYRRRVYCCYESLQRDDMDEAILQRIEYA